MNNYARATRHVAHRVELALVRRPLVSVAAMVVAPTTVVAAIIAGLLLTTVPEPIISAPIRW